MTNGEGRSPRFGADPDVRARGLVDQVTAAEGASTPDAWLQQLCRGAAAGLSLRGSVIHVVTSAGASGVAASSDESSGRIADLAFTTGEGPSMDAFALRRPVLVSDLAQDAGRWPGFAQAAAEVGVRAVFSLPLRIGGATLGVLDLYADRLSSLSDADLALALAFARLAAHGLLGESPSWPGGLGWEPLLDHRAEVHQAQGMVMVDLQVDLAEALLRMRAFAFAEGIALIDLAHAILGGSTLPSTATGLP